jgi:hypothetical protein
MVWWLGLQLLMQSVPITTEVVNLMLLMARCTRYIMLQHYVIKFVIDLRQVVSFHQVLCFPLPTKLTATI